MFGNLPPHPAAGEAVKRAVDSNRYSGMTHSAGIMEVRECVAQQLSKYPSKHKLKAEVSECHIHCKSNPVGPPCFCQRSSRQSYGAAGLVKSPLLPSPPPLPTPQDIFMTCGTHGALETSFRVLCEPGRSILLSSPCYTIYRCLASALQITPKHYTLLVRGALKPL